MKDPDTAETLHVNTRKAWRTWLQTNHDSKNRIWLIYHKKHTGKPRVAYGEAVEEAICFGWIDSIVRRIDEDRYMQKFTPRKPTSRWSDLNKNRAWKMLNEKKMTPAGLAVAGEWIHREGPAKKKDPGPEPAVPKWMARALENNRKAKEYFDGLAPSYRRHYILWLTSARREETRQRRLNEALGLLAEGKKLPMK